MKLSTLLVSSLFALLFCSLGVASLPLGYAPRRHHARRHHSRQVSAHDDYEAQLGKLEAALAHYDEYGDAESLKTYLTGFTDANGGADAMSGGSGAHVSQGQNDSESKASQDGQKKEAKHESKPQPAKAPEQAPQQTSQQDGNSKQQQDGDHHEDCEDNSSQNHDQPEAQQPQPSQRKKSHKAAVSHPSQPKVDQHSEPAGYAPTPGFSSSNTIDGYTPPSFHTSSSPSTTSLYTSAPFSGKATFYNPSVGLGACGIQNFDEQPVVAVSKDLFEQYNPSSGNSNHNSMCGRKIEINWAGKTVQAFAMDECPSCDPTSLDLSPTVFQMLDRKSKGVLDGISWKFV